VGIYSPEDRKSRIHRFLEKRKRRMWTKKVKYDVRKNFADSRVRVKGRFVKKEEGEGVVSPDSEEGYRGEGGYRGGGEGAELDTSNNTNYSQDEEEGVGAVA
ncbi:CCT motif-domain-containing protein, partial [Ochromonadaceae sp. CCMP2298]